MKPRLKVDVPEHILKGMLLEKKNQERLIDINELAEICGTTRQRMHYLYKQKKEGKLLTRSFPTPQYFYKYKIENGKETFSPLFTLKQAESYCDYLKYINEYEEAYERGKTD